MSSEFESNPLSDVADRRGAKRQRGIRKGTILFDGGNGTQPCAILDVSATGARPVSYTHLTLPTIYSV